MVKKKDYGWFFRNFAIFNSAKGALDHLLTLIHPLRLSALARLSLARLLSRALKKKR
ncbi:MAG: hypothetical protein WAL90_09290 [Desulfobacterales bacterium]